MLHRCYTHDYRARSIYLLTLTVEGRRPLLGSLVTADTDACGIAARIAPTALGAEVEAAVGNLPSYYPQLRVLAHQLMPDHLHIVLFVTERLPVPLGQVISGFKMGTNRCYWQRMEAQGLLPPHTRRERDRSAVAQGGTAKRCQAEQRLPRLWAEGFHDSLLLHQGQLQAMLQYVADNPRRLAVKRAHPGLFTLQRQLAAGGRCFTAIGNEALLHRPERLQVQCSRSITPEELEERQRLLLAAARHGAVLVSPCISHGEKAIATAALTEGLPLIVLLENGFEPLYKPTGRYFDACAAGRLLMLAPWEHHAARTVITRQQCQALNIMARDICAPDDGRPGA